MTLVAPELRATILHRDRAYRTVSRGRRLALLNEHLNRHAPRLNDAQSQGKQGAAAQRTDTAAPMCRRSHADAAMQS